MLTSIDRQNSFNFLRLAFAVAVVVSHSFGIGGFGADPVMRATDDQVRLGSGAVLCFFIVSGYLITSSALRQPFWRFALHRAARILPGFWAVQLLTAFVLAPAIILANYPELVGYFDSLMLGRESALAYLANNAFLQINQFEIGGVFVDLPVHGQVNGSLWSLGPEAVCYIYLALLALCGALRTRIVTVLLFAVVYGLHAFAHFDRTAILPSASFLAKGGILLFENPHYRSLYVAFVAGMLFFQFRHRLRWRLSWLVIALLLLIGSCCFYSFALVWPFTLPYIVLCLAHRLPLRRAERWGDFSFGIYIYAFPIQQCLALAGFQRFGIIPFILASVTLALAAGLLSWRWIEEPVLRWARSFRTKRAIFPDPMLQTIHPACSAATPGPAPLNRFA